MTMKSAETSHSSTPRDTDKSKAGGERESGCIIRYRQSADSDKWRTVRSPGFSLRIKDRKMKQTLKEIKSRRGAALCFSAVV